MSDKVTRRITERQIGDRLRYRNRLQRWILGGTAIVGALTGWAQEGSGDSPVPLVLGVGVASLIAANCRTARNDCEGFVHQYANGRQIPDVFGSDSAWFSHSMAALSAGAGHALLASELVKNGAQGFAEMSSASVSGAALVGAAVVTQVGIEVANRRPSHYVAQLNALDKLGTQPGPASA